MNTYSIRLGNDTAGVTLELSTTPTPTMFNLRLLTDTPFGDDMLYEMEIAAPDLEPEIAMAIDEAHDILHEWPMDFSTLPNFDEPIASMFIIARSLSLGVPAIA